MPRGDEPIAHGCWHEIPGVEGARIWPFLRKVDNVSSNTYLVRSGSLTLVIDPGALPDQAREIAAALSPTAEIAPRSILVILTHAHVDHFRSLIDYPYFRNNPSLCVAVHETGARAVATADTNLTQAALLGQTLQMVEVALPLFAGPTARVPCGTGIRLVTGERSLRDGTVIPEQVLNTEDSCDVFLYPAPGHSPDSICIRIGSYLFIGDLLFAAGMGVAGMSGWNRDDLVRSIGHILALLQEGSITHCFPGHGKVLTCEEAVRVLESVKRDAATLDGIEELNSSRATETALYAEGLMDEVEELFTIIAARLLYVSHVLDELDEAGEADAIKKLIDTDRLDELMTDFHRFSAEHRAGGKADIQLALKAGQIVGKLDRMFAQQDLALVLDPEYVRRAGRLLCDYTTVLRGFRQPRMLRKTAPATMVAGLIGSLNQSGERNEDLIGSADNPAAFTRALIRKIARSPAFDDVTCACTEDSCTCTAEIDAAILGDVILAVLEDLAGAGCREISVRVATGGRGISITIASPFGMPVPYDLRKRFLQDECARAGGTLAWLTDAEPASVRIDLPSPDL
ncbi:MAG TPA: MBL fold metallo-hydrolase [Methanoregulaceae archaeon]|nr:MBL fold metallo-hydrolase [Methanoregulaceae archaeon]